MDQQVLDKKLAKVQQRLSLNAVDQDYLLVLTRKQTFFKTLKNLRQLKYTLKKKTNHGVWECPNKCRQDLMVNFYLHQRLDGLLSQGVV